MFTSRAQPRTDGPACWPQRGFDAVGARISLLIDHFKPLRIMALVIVFAVVLATNVDQVSELFLIALWVDNQWIKFAWLLATSTLAGFAFWYAARNAYRMTYPRWPALQDPRGQWLRSWLPRILGAAIPALVVVGYGVAQHHAGATCVPGVDCARRDVRSALLLATSAALMIVLIMRRRVINGIPGPRQGMRISREPAGEARVRSVCDLGRPALVLYGLTVVLNVAATVLIAQIPEILDGIGPLAILLIAATFFCLSGGFLCMLADVRGLPLLSLLLLVSVVFHIAHWNDNHRVRQYDGMSTHEDPQTGPTLARPTFNEYADAWLAQRCEHRRTCPVVLVSAEGGGIRGAAWTAMVLSRLTSLVEDRHPSQGEPQLARYIFAGSGVSGGSLGLATYAALLDTKPKEIDVNWVRRFDAKAEGMLTSDFLAPMLANMFFVDFTQRWLWGAWFDDRSRALTRAWEQAARRQGMPAFSQPFSNLNRDAKGAVSLDHPALFLNSTTVAEGERLIQHPFFPVSINAPHAWTAAFDGSQWLSPNVPLSEVVLNSARFTYVSPAGTLAAWPGALRPDPAHLQLVDGGYYENSGATTLLEVMALLRKAAAKHAWPSGPNGANVPQLRFIVLHISNDPELREFVNNVPASGTPLAYAAYCRLPDQHTAPAGEVTSPAKALLHTRSARAEYARAQLLADLDIDAGHPRQSDILWHFRLCERHYPIPLGWTISEPVYDEMREQLKEYPLDVMATELDARLSGDQD